MDEKPYRYRKKLVKIGNSRYVIMPACWNHHDDKEITVEVYKDKVVILPVK